MTTAVSREREALMSDSKLTILGARVHNLKNVDVEIPRHSLTVITGLSHQHRAEDHQQESAQYRRHHHRNI